MKKTKTESHVWWCCGSSLFWGILLLVLGLWYLAQDLGYISFSVSIWPVVLIVLGLWILLKKNRCY